MEDKEKVTQDTSAGCGSGCLTWAAAAAST